METVSRRFLGLGAAMLFLATAFGAYGSHGLAGQADAATQSAFATAVDYQFYHGLGLIAVAILTELRPRVRIFAVAGWLLVAGIVLFCGGIYATTFGGPQALSLVTPLGGMAFMVAWLVLASGAWVARERGAADPLA